MGTTKVLQQSTPSSSLERAAYTIPEFCFRNHISRPAYHRLRCRGTRPGGDADRIEHHPHHRRGRAGLAAAMQEPNEDLEQQAVERAVKAGEAAVRSDKHISKKGRRP